MEKTLSTKQIQLALLYPPHRHLNRVLQQHVLLQTHPQLQTLHLLLRRTLTLLRLSFILYLVDRRLLPLQGLPDEEQILTQVVFWLRQQLIDVPENDFIKMLYFFGHGRGKIGQTLVEGVGYAVKFLSSGFAAGLSPDLRHRICLRIIKIIENYHKKISFPLTSLF